MARQSGRGRRVSVDIEPRRPVVVGWLHRARRVHLRARGRRRGNGARTVARPFSRTLERISRAADRRRDWVRFGRRRRRRRGMREHTTDKSPPSRNSFRFNRRDASSPRATAARPRPRFSPRSRRMLLQTLETRGSSLSLLRQRNEKRARRGGGRGEGERKGNEENVRRTFRTKPREPCTAAARPVDSISGGNPSPVCFPRCELLSPASLPPCSTPLPATLPPLRRWFFTQSYEARSRGWSRVKTSESGSGIRLEYRRATARQTGPLWRARCSRVYGVEGRGEGDRYRMVARSRRAARLKTKGGKQGGRSVDTGRRTRRGT